MSEDFLHQTRIDQRNMDLDYTDNIFNKALIYIEDKIILLGRTDLRSFRLPQLIRSQDLAMPSEEFIERNYDTDELSAYIQENEPKLVQNQKEAFDQITKAVLGQ